jgi:hypothetical protein
MSSLLVREHKIHRRLLPGSILQAWYIQVRVGGDRFRMNLRCSVTGSVRRTGNATGSVWLTWIRLVRRMISMVDGLARACRSGCVTMRGTHARGLGGGKAREISTSVGTSGNEILQSVGLEAEDTRTRGALARDRVGRCNAAATTMIALDLDLLRVTLTRR